MEILRQEIIETQKARNELIKWKLLLVSALGAAGFGFADSNNKINTEVLLCCIPFVCAYVDSQYMNLSLRIVNIATFFREVGPHVGVDKSFTEYEKLMDCTLVNIREGYIKFGRHSPQSWNIRISTILFSGFIALYALVSLLVRKPKPDIWVSIAMIIAGTVGVVFDFVLFRHSQGRRKIIENTAREFVARITKVSTEHADSVGPR